MMEENFYFVLLRFKFEINKCVFYVNKLEKLRRVDKEVFKC